MPWNDTLADMFDPPLADGVESWICYRDSCDGQPHDEYTWRHARWKQRPPEGDWYLWLILAGRGFGKTRTGAEWLADQMLAHPGTFWAIIVPTFDDGRDIAVEGESGLQFVLDRLNIRYTWNRALGHLIMFNGARMDIFSAEKPESLRGPNLTGAWGDEPATWKYPDATWSNLQLMTRKGQPHIMITGTPRPTRFVRQLMSDADSLIEGNTYENEANLSPIWFDKVIRPMEGTALGQQEIYARVLDQAGGALWERGWINVQVMPELDTLDRVRVGWDPAITSTSKSDAHGIIVLGQEPKRVVGKDDRGKAIWVAKRWALADRSDVLTPEAAAKRVVQAAVEYGAARVFYEPNQGGDTWPILYKSAAKALGLKAPPIEPRTAKNSKETRAAPVAQVYEQQFNMGRDLIAHVEGLDELEMEQCTWEPGVSKESPNRIDALSLVWQGMDTVRGTSTAGKPAQVVRDSPQARRDARRKQLRPTFAGRG